MEVCVCCWGWFSSHHRVLVVHTRSYIRHVGISDPQIHGQIGPRIYDRYDSYIRSRATRSRSRPPAQLGRTLSHRAPSPSSFPSTSSIATLASYTFGLGGTSDPVTARSLAPHKMSAAMAMRCLRPRGPVAAFATREGPALGSNSCRRLRPLSTWNWSKKVTPAPTPPPSSEDTAGAAQALGGGVPSSSAQQAILSKCSHLHSSIMPMNASLGGPLAKNSDRGTSLPFVFLVGNHSS